MRAKVLRVHLSAFISSGTPSSYTACESLALWRSLRAIHRIFDEYENFRFYENIILWVIEDVESHYEMKMIYLF